MKAERGRSSGRALGGAHWEAFHKDLDLVQHIKWTFFKAHPLVFHKEVTYELTNVFRAKAEMAGLMDTKIHWVQDQWQGKKEFCTANYMARGSVKDLHYFWVVSPLKSPKIMGLKGIHSPEALKHQVRLSFCPWCGKEGKNEGTMVNHPCTRHYHIRLINERCLSYFMATLDKMLHHTQGCESTHFHKGKPDEEVEKAP